MPSLPGLDPLGLANELPQAPLWDRAVLDALLRHIGADAAALCVLGEPPVTTLLDAARLDAAVQHDTFARDLAPVKRAAMAAHGVAVDTAVLGERAVRATAYHREFARPIGGRHSLMAFLSLRGRPFGTLMLGRCGSTFTDAEVAAVTTALPSLAVARASYRAPWMGGALPADDAPPWTRAARWLRGERVIERVGDGDAAVAVRDVGAYREMVASAAGRELVWTRASIAEPSRSGWFYVELLHLAAARARHRTRALFIGCGGGVGARRFAEVYPGMAIDVVELDPRVLDLARRWFALDEVPGVAAHVADGAAFVAAAAPATWDVVVVDAYDGVELAAPLASAGFFAALRRSLRPGGAAAFNVIGCLDGEGDVARVARGLQGELDDVRLVPVLDPGEAYAPSSLRNVVVIGSRA